MYPVGTKFSILANIITVGNFNNGLQRIGRARTMSKRRLPCAIEKERNSIRSPTPPHEHISVRNILGCVLAGVIKRDFSQKYAPTATV